MKKIVWLIIGLFLLGGCKPEEIIPIQKPDIIDNFSTY